MKRLILLALGLYYVSAQETETLKEFSVGYNEFTSDIYKELVKSNSGNIIVCPLSADIVLALTGRGARGQTANELRTSLHLPEEESKIDEVFETISPKLQNDGKYTLTSANKVYVKTGFEIDEKFKDVAEDVFRAEIENVDFSKSESAAAKINAWVSEQTRGKIDKLISPDLLNEDTRTVLVNAIYFRGKWAKAFKKHNTLTKPFHVNSKTEMKTHMMHETARYEYYHDTQLNAKFLKMRYQGDDVSMHVVLPDDIEGLGALEEKLITAFNPPPYRYERVSVKLPKFKVKTTIKFNPILKKLGVKEAFEDSADFRGISALQEPIKISEVVQKALIEVDEEGTVAAAATGVMNTMTLSLTLPELPPKIFHADHPFLFYLRLDKLGVNFFVGRYTSPA